MTATEVVRVVVAWATADEENASMVAASASARLSQDPARDTYRDHVNTGLRSSD